jgi:hypothetical protein
MQTHYALRFRIVVYYHQSDRSYGLSQYLAVRAYCPTQRETDIMSAQILVPFGSYRDTNPIRGILMGTPHPIRSLRLTPPHTGLNSDELVTCRIGSAYYMPSLCNVI